MVEPVACGIHGMKQIELQLGEHVLIFGCGPIGLILMQLCQTGGFVLLANKELRAKRIAATVTMVDIQENKLELAEKLGATNILLADDDLKQRLFQVVSHGFHVVIDATGNPHVVEQMFDYVRDKGRILFFGVCPADAKIQISPYDVYKRELKICGTFALLHTARQAVDVIRSTKVDVESLVSHQFPLEDFEAAFELKQQGKDALKIMIVP